MKGARSDALCIGIANRSKIKILRAIDPKMWSVVFIAFDPEIGPVATTENAPRIGVNAA